MKLRYTDCVNPKVVLMQVEAFKKSLIVRNYKRINNKTYSYKMHWAGEPCYRGLYHYVRDYPNA